MRAKPSARGGVLAIQRQVDAIAGGGAERIGVDPVQRAWRARTRVVDEGLGPAGPPHRRSTTPRRAAGACSRASAASRSACARSQATSAMSRHSGLQLDQARPSATAASRPAPGRCGCGRCGSCGPASPRRSVSRASIAEWPSSKRSSSTKAPLREIVAPARRSSRRRAVELRRRRGCRCRCRPSACAVLARDVVAGSNSRSSSTSSPARKCMMRGVDRDAGFLPQQVAHVARSPTGCRSSSSPKARLRFCSACVAAPFSRLSSGRDHDQRAGHRRTA